MLSSRKKMIYLIACMLVCLVPVMATSALLAYVHGASLLGFAPFFSDELFHWHQGLSFSQVGLNNGYYTVAELTPTLEGFRYYAWSFATYAFYGLIGRVFGWGFVTPVVLHASLITFGMAFLVRVMRPDKWQLMALGAFTATSMLILMHLPLAMQEGLHTAWAIVLAGALYRLLTQPVSAHERLVWAAFLLLISLMRPTWGLLVLPMLILSAPQRHARTFIVALLISVPMVALVGYFFQATSAPYGTSDYDDFMRSVGESPLNIVGLLISYTGQAVTTVLSLDDAFGVQSGDYTRAQRLHLLGLMLIGLGMLVAHRRGQGAWEGAFHLYNIGVTFGLVMVLYGIADGHDYRVLAPHVLLSVLLLIACRRWRAFGLMMALSLPFYAYGNFWSEYDTLRGAYDGVVRAHYAEWSPRLQEAGVVYDVDAPNAWCNTALTSFFYISARQGLILGLDAGLGISFIFGEYGVPIPPQSAYLLLTHDDITALQGRVTLAPLLDLPDGVLYRNMDSPCYTSAMRG